MKKIATLLGLGLGLAVISADPAAAQNKLNLRLDWSFYGTHSAFYLGIAQGLYKAEGIDLTIGEGSGSGNTAKLLAQNTDSVAFLDFGTMTKGIGTGMPIKGVLGVHQRSPMMILSHADTPVNSPKDLEGKVIAMAPAESTAQMFPVLLSANTVDAAKISVLAPATGAKTAMFLQKRVDAITGVLAKELGAKNIRVNALNPGLTITEGTHTAGIAGSDFEKDAVSKTPLGRAGRPEDIARAAVFLASDDAGWVTGDRLRVGGGIY